MEMAMFSKQQSRIPPSHGGYRTPAEHSSTDRALLAGLLYRRLRKVPVNRELPLIAPFDGINVKP